jgi:nucleoside-diphosphate-sugar epimerase
MSKVLVTGAGGFLGKQIVEQLLIAGYTDLVLGVRQAAATNALRIMCEAYPGVSVKVETANLLDAQRTAQAVTGVDIVIHAAAGTKGGAADMFLNSVLGTRNLVDACKANQVKKLIFISSFSVYSTYSMQAGDCLDENSPTETTGVTKGAYAYTKVQQELLARQWLANTGIETIFVRPGVIYGSGGSGMSSRVGISALGVFASLGGSTLLPLTHVRNCAKAIVYATKNGKPNDVFNVTDDDLPTCRQYLNQYRKTVRSFRAIPVPYPVLLAGAKWLESYSKKSKGQLPAILTPYVVKSMYRPFRYSNAKLKSIGWSQDVSTAEGLAQTLTALAKLEP